MSTTQCFLSLPVELQIEALMHLDHRSLLQCTLVCKSMNRSIAESSELQFIIELGSGGMEFVGERTTRSYPDLLKQLRERRDSWDRLDWRKFENVTVESGFKAYELVAGTFSSSNGEDLRVTWLPSATSDARSVHHLEMGFLLRDYAIDPTQDLVIILEEDFVPLSLVQPRTVNVHVHTISSNKKHPLARAGVLSFIISADSSHGNGIYTAALAIAYDIVALTISTGLASYGIRILIWNWKDGWLIYDSQTEGLMDHVCDFALLGRHAFMMMSKAYSGSLQIYSMPHPTVSRPIHVASLQLPDLHPQQRVRYLSAHSGPVHAHPPEHATFTTAPDVRMQVISVSLSSGSMSTGSYTIFVHDRTLLRCIDEYAGDESYRTVNIPWDSWGPDNTRFLPSRETHWLRYVQGQRAVFSTSGTSIDVFEFNDKMDLPVSHAHRRFTRLEPSSIPKLDYFANDVVTHLPFRVATRRMTQSYYAFMIDEERIIGLENEESGSLSLHVYIF